MPKKCRHQKGIILAFARGVEFVPDQEPFVADVIEPSGYEAIIANAIAIYWCPKCKVAKSIEVDDGDWEAEES